MKRPTPTATESPFELHELFFSTTNERGIVQSGNDVFFRVSKYPEERVVGSPHSLIRHPDMPRAVFKLFWDTISNKEPIMAYVKNLAADGSYYWVFAFVFPIKEGYLSIRIKPSSPILRTVEELYKEVRELESNESVETAKDILLEKVRGLGFSSYTDFMVKAAFAELQGLSVNSENTDALNKDSDEISTISSTVRKELGNCLRKVQNFQNSNTNFVATSNKLNDAFQELKFIALNMTVSAAKFGEALASLGVVSKEFSTLSEEIQARLSGLAQFVDVLSGVVAQSALRISSLEVQMLMVAFFIKESNSKSQIDDADAFAALNKNRNNFTSLFSEYSQGLSKEMIAVKDQLASVANEMQEIRKLTTGLEVIRQIGAVESSRHNDVKQTFSHYLESMRKFIELLQDSTSSTMREIQAMAMDREAIVKTSAQLPENIEAIFNLTALPK